MGRIYVSKQVMCSMITYHAAFFSVPPEIMQEMVSITDTFISKPSVAATGGVLPTSTYQPAKAITVLPLKEGGMAACDIKIQCTAMLARNIAMLTHPRAHPWKTLLQAALQFTSAAQLGPIISCLAPALTSLQTRSITNTKLVSKRTLDLLKAMQDLKPFRLINPDDMKPWQILTEPVFFNSRIRLASDTILHPQQGQLGPALICLHITKLRDVHAILRHNPAGQPIHPAIIQLLQILPQSWRTVVEHPAIPASDFYMTQPAPGQTIYISTSQQPITDANGAHIFTVNHDGSVRPVPRPWAPFVTNLSFTIPAQVIGMQVEETDHQRKTNKIFFKGPWDQADLDPTVWGLHEPGLHDTVVKKAAIRGKTIQMMKHYRRKNDFIPESGIIPALWRDPADEFRQGLTGMEQKWQQDYSRLSTAAGIQNQAAVNHAPAPPSTSNRSRISSNQFSAIQAPAWMRSTHVFNTDIRAQQSAAAEAQHEQRMNQQLAVAERGQLRRRDPDYDLKDFCQPSLEQVTKAHRLEYKKAYKRLFLPHLPREAKCLSWRILHGSLFCGGFLCHFLGAQALPDACCKSPNCQSQLETLSHTFLLCPDVKPAARWIFNVYAAVAGSAVELTDESMSLVLLADDHRVWKPEDQLQDLWTTLRTAFLHAVWTLRSYRRININASVSPAAIAAMVVKAVTAAIKNDWVRASTDIRTATDVCCSWFKGRNPVMEESEFIARWCYRGVLCSIQGGNVHVAFTTSQPTSI
jgi:hypothetical protein